MSRPKQMPAGVSRAAKGLRIRFDGPPHPDGSRRGKTEVLVGVWVPEKAAEIRAARIRRVQVARKNGALSSTVDDIIDRFKEEEYPRLAPLTRRSYDSIFRCLIKPSLGRAGILDLTPSFIQATVKTWETQGGQSGGRLSAKTVRSAHGLLHLLLNDARVREVLNGNPARGTRLPRWEPVGGVVVTTRQMMRLANGMSDPAIQILAVTMWGIGLRPGEALRLRIEDFLPRHHLLLVRRASDGVGGVKRPKDSDPRALPLPEDLLVELERHVDSVRARAEAFGPEYRWDLGLLFSKADGSPITGEQLRHAFHVASRIAELPFDARPKDMRSSWATLSDQRAVDEDEVDAISQGLGHSHGLTTKRHYIARRERPVPLPKARQRVVAKRMNSRIQRVRAHLRAPTTG